MKIGDIIRSKTTNEKLRVKRIYDIFFVVEQIDKPKRQYPMGKFYQLSIIKNKNIRSYLV